ncbi:MAG: hypothetical protein ACRED9_04290 [Caulobacteraceae bacterium]
MPELLNPRHEAFARARSRGVRLQDAYEEAGYAPDRSHASRLAGRPEIAERIAELRHDRLQADPMTIIGTLMRIAGELMSQGTVPAYKEARAALVEARRIRAEMAADFEQDRQEPVKSSVCEPILRLPFTPSAAQCDLAAAN